MISRLVSRDVFASACRSSTRLEPEVWSAVEEICRREQIQLRELLRRVELTGAAVDRSSRIRTFVDDYFRKAGIEQDRRLTGYITSPGSSAFRTGAVCPSDPTRAGS